ncbi:MAG: pilus assembly protein CpaE, partial [Planctomycetota bacterium]
FWQLPNDYRTMIEVRNNGVPLIEQAPKAPITQLIVGLAEAISNTQKGPLADPVTKQSGWGRLFGKGGK